MRSASVSGSLVSSGIAKQSKFAPVPRVRISHCYWLRVALLAGCMSLPIVTTAAANAPPDYAKQIAPLLTKYCAGCHDAENHEGDFILDTYQALGKGGKHGPAVLAGDAAASRMYRAMSRQAEP